MTLDEKEWNVINKLDIIDHFKRLNNKVKRFYSEDTELSKKFNELYVIISASEDEYLKELEDINNQIYVEYNKDNS